MNDSITSEAWQRLVTQGMRNPKSLVFYFAIIFLFLSIIETALYNTSPVPNLEQLEMRTGTIFRAYTTGRTHDQWIDLKVPSGQIISYQIYTRSLNEFEKVRALIGAHVTVWSQSRFSLDPFYFGYTEWLLQLQFKDSLILDYEHHVRPIYVKMKDRKWFNYIGDYFLPLSLIGLFLALIWRDNKDQPDNPL